MRWRHTSKCRERSGTRRTKEAMLEASKVVSPMGRDFVLVVDLKKEDPRRST